MTQPRLVPNGYTKLHRASIRRYTTSWQTWFYNPTRKLEPIPKPIPFRLTIPTWPGRGRRRVRVKTARIPVRPTLVPRGEEVQVSFWSFWTSWKLCPESQLAVESAVLDGFEDVVGQDFIAVGDIGDGAAQSKDLIMSPG